MAPAPPPLPTRFPCWCRAVYSWGGESKRDLGFIEGDLIECLNAGDGSWWTGRLRRDRRMVGVFPSNFVELLPDDFRPMSRSTSPMPQSNTPSPKNTPQKSRTFRKPFEAYAKAPHYTTAKQPETYRPSASPVRSRENSSNSFSNAAPAGIDRAASPAPPTSYDEIRRGLSPAPQASYEEMRRAASPAPPRGYEGAVRAPSPAPLMHGFGSRAPSPAPPMHSYGSRAPSPAPSAYRPYRPPGGPQRSSQEELHFGGGAEGPESPPPPAPPPHRHVVGRQGSTISYDSRGNGGLERHGSNMSYDARSAGGLGRQGSNLSYDHRQAHAPLERHGSNVSYDHHRSTGYHTPRVPSPCPPSPGGGGLTPSPLREAMDGVLDQLDALGVPRDAQSPEPPFDPWSPESFDMVHQQSRRHHKREKPRPQTSMGIARADSGYETYSGGSSQENSQENTYHDRQYNEAPLPQLSNYVERMETRLRNMHNHTTATSLVGDEGPLPPPKGQTFERPKSSMGSSVHGGGGSVPKLRHRKSAYDVGRQVLGRTFTTKTNSTSTSSGNHSTTTQSTNHSLMSGVSAGGISATSAGSLARKNQIRAQSAMGMRDADMDRPETPFTGVTYHSSHASGVSRPKSQSGFREDPMGNIGGLGGLTQPKTKKSNFFKKILESAKTGVASTRGSIATAGAGSVQSSSSSLALNRSMPPGMTGIAGGLGSPMGGREGNGAAREMGLGGGIDWVQIRRDVNRSNTLSRNEREERRDRCQMMDYPALDPVDELYSSINGDEGADGMPVAEPTNYGGINLSQVDKNSRFIIGLPPATTAITLATTYVCRPFRSDVQRLRAIFTWVAEKICWEEDFEGEIDTRRVIQTKRGCAEEYAVLVLEMCAAVGLACEVVRGYLKTPGEIPETGLMPRSNHWWNAVVVDGEWRVMDCCLASPSNPRRALYSGAGSGGADPWWFLARPTEACWTHIAEHHAQQHICPPVAHEVLLNLPCACPPYFGNGLRMLGYNTSLTRIEDLEMVHVQFSVPEDVEAAAEVEVRSFSRDSDGDLFESGEVVRKRALAQADWVAGVKRYTVKALLPSDEGNGVLKVYAGKRGLMHSIKDIPHPLAFALPIIHSGENPPYEFVARHPTPHAQRHDIYVVQPQCRRLALNNTFVFAVRQHPSSTGAASAAMGASSMTPSSNPGRAPSPLPFVRPGSAMSMTSSSAAGSQPGGSSSNPSTSSSASSSAYIQGKKPAKLAVQTPGGKILRLMRKEERRGIGVGVGGGRSGEGDASDGGVWETIIKCSEKGVWRGLVLADRTARWCVFAEWICDG